MAVLLRGLHLNRDRGQSKEKLRENKEKLVVLVVLGFFLYFPHCFFVFPWIFVREGFPKIPSKCALNPPKYFPYVFASGGKFSAVLTSNSDSSSQKTNEDNF